jgi:hypothetical protein
MLGHMKERGIVNRGFLLTSGLLIALATSCGGRGGSAATGSAGITTAPALATSANSSTSTATATTTGSVTSSSSGHPATVNTTFTLTIQGMPAETDAFSVFFANPGLGQTEYVFCSPPPHSPCHAGTYKVSLDSAYQASADAPWRYERTSGASGARQTTTFKQGVAPLNNNYSVAATYTY